MDNQETHSQVKEYYGETLSSSEDLKTDACCSIDYYPDHVKAALSEIHPEVMDKFYGCGSPIPDSVAGLTVLDLGCGSGRDCYVLSKLVGETGKVIGLDMTDKQLEVANRHVGYHREKFGYKESNVVFKKGQIEDLSSIGLADNSIDLVVSNCVINLSPEKERVFKEIFRVLKPGGELFFSDIFSDCRIPAELAKDQVLLGECLGGALYWEDFRRLMSKLGCQDFRTTTARPLSIDNDDIVKQLDGIGFISATVRAFNIELEDRCEDFGQSATYLGTIPESPEHFDLDDHHRLEKGEKFRVCGNSFDMLAQTRFAKHFEFEGDKSRHLGLFDCGPSGVELQGEDCCPPSGGCC